MDSIIIHLDYVLAQYAKQRTIMLDQGEIPAPITVKKLLEELNIPSGMVGHIVCDGRLLDTAYELSAPCLIKMFGIYSGG